MFLGHLSPRVVASLAISGTSSLGASREPPCSLPADRHSKWFPPGCGLSCVSKGLDRRLLPQGQKALGLVGWMLAQALFPCPGFSRFHDFCWMEATLPCVSDCGPHPHPSAGHPWQEIGGPFPPRCTAILSAPHQGGVGPPTNVKGRKPEPGVTPFREPGWNS